MTHLPRTHAVCFSDSKTRIRQADVRWWTLVLTLVLCSSLLCRSAPSQEQAEADSQTGKTLNVLFVGNSYTARHHLATVVKQLAEAADPDLTFRPTQVIYGGRTLRDHWRLGTQHVVNRHAVTAEEVKQTIKKLEAAVKEDPNDQHATRGLVRMRSLLLEIESGDLDRTKWDWVVLQSYRDDLDGEGSSYMEYAPRFVSLAKRQGAQALLYETTPTTQNQFPIAQHQDSTPVIEKAKSIAKLADRTETAVAPMSYVALQGQIGNPEITLRFENDAHLNQTMAYLTACTIYAAMFGVSPEGLPVDSVTDIRYWQNDRSSGKDRDNKPIRKDFSERERQFLQSTAWKALQEFKEQF